MSVLTHCLSASDPAPVPARRQHPLLSRPQAADPPGDEPRRPAPEPSMPTTIGTRSRSVIAEPSLFLTQPPLQLVLISGYAYARRRLGSARDGARRGLLNPAAVHENFRNHGNSRQAGELPSRLRPVPDRYARAARRAEWACPGAFLGLIAWPAARLHPRGPRPGHACCLAG
jgi:hypothetical protein